MYNNMNAGIGCQTSTLLEATHDAWSSGKKHIIITGDGGTGKSSLLLSMFFHVTSLDNVIPLFFDLSQMRENETIQERLIADYCGQIINDAVSQDLKAAFSGNKALPESRYVFFIDGINETDDTDRYLTEICKFIQDYDLVQIVMASRRFFHKLSGYFCEYSIRPLSHKQVQCALESANIKVEEIPAGLMGLMNRPLFLSLFIKEWYENGLTQSDQVISTAGEFFDSHFNRLVTNNQTGDGNIRAEFALLYLLPAMTKSLSYEFSWSTFCKVFEAAHPYVEARYGAFEERHSFSKPAAFKELLINKGILLASEQSNRYHYRHAYYHEYLIAKYYCNELTMVEKNIPIEFKYHLPDYLYTWIGEILGEHHYIMKSPATEPIVPSPIEHWLELNCTSKNLGSERAVVTANMVEIMKRCRNNLITSNYNKLDLSKTDMYGSSLQGSTFRAANISNSFLPPPSGSIISVSNNGRYAVIEKELAYGTRNHFLLDIESRRFTFYGGNHKDFAFSDDSTLLGSISISNDNTAPNHNSVCILKTAQIGQTNLNEMRLYTSTDGLFSLSMSPNMRYVTVSTFDMIILIPTNGTPSCSYDIDTQFDLLPSVIIDQSQVLVCHRDSTHEYMIRALDIIESPSGSVSLVDTDEIYYISEKPEKIAATEEYLIVSTWAKFWLIDRLTKEQTMISTPSDYHKCHAVFSVNGCVLLPSLLSPPLQVYRIPEKSITSITEDWDAISNGIVSAISKNGAYFAAEGTIYDTTSIKAYYSLPSIHSVLKAAISIDGTQLCCLLGFKQNNTLYFMRLLDLKNSKQKTYTIHSRTLADSFPTEITDICIGDNNIYLVGSNSSSFLIIQVEIESRLVSAHRVDKDRLNAALKLFRKRTKTIGEYYEVLLRKLYDEGNKPFKKTSASESMFREFSPNKTNVIDSIISEDGKYVAFLEENRSHHTLRVFELSTGKHRYYTLNDCSLIDSRFSRLLYFSSNYKHVYFGYYSFTQNSLDYIQKNLGYIPTAVQKHFHLTGVLFLTTGLTVNAECPIAKNRIAIRQDSQSVLVFNYLSGVKTKCYDNLIYCNLDECDFNNAQLDDASKRLLRDNYII